MVYGPMPIPSTSASISAPATAKPMQQFLQLTVSGDSHAALKEDEEDATCLLTYFISPHCLFYLTLTFDTKKTQPAF